MTTDGESLVVTELSDPTSVNPLKYGSSEADPDPIKALLKIRNEPYALNRYTVEVFDNVGGDGFPFQRIEGAQIEKGTVGTHACCVFDEELAFVGGGRNEGISIYIAAGGQIADIATSEIIQQIETLTQSELEGIKLESVIDKDQTLLYVHLPDRTLVYDGRQSRSLGMPVWFTLSSSSAGLGQYKAMHHVYCYGKWQIIDPSQAAQGYIDEAIATQWGNGVEWELTTPIIYNESRGAAVHSLELVNKSALATTATVEFSDDGENWTQGAAIDAFKRLVWLKQGYFEEWRILRFAGTGQLTVARLEAAIEPLYV